MTPAPQVKILVACHRADAFVPEVESLAPIQVGAEAAKSRIPGMLHDDEGDNISCKNAMYCETTALYWAWKNLPQNDGDYIGLFHYRRYMSFSQTRFKTNFFGDALFDRLDDDAARDINLTDKAIAEAVRGCDVVTTEPGAFVGNPTMEQQWDKSWQNNPADLRLLREIVDELSPEMVPAYDKYMASRKGYFCNMFIMRRSVFDDYCKWMFGVLEEHERRADYSSYDATSYRISGYLAERLTGIYITYLKSKGARVKELQRAFFENATKPAEIKPAFGNAATASSASETAAASASGNAASHAPASDLVTLVLASDDYYVPYLSALLQSVKDTSSPERLYDIIVLTRDISASNQSVMKQQIEQENISLRFYDVSMQMSDYVDLLDLHGHFQIETYYRLLMQDVLEDWDKVLYLDSDMIVCRDIAELFDADVDGYLLGAVRDADTAGLYNGYNPQMKGYMDDVLGIKNPFDYFQAGTILFNLDEFRSTFETSEIFAFATAEEWKLLDQDVLNFIAQGCVKFLPMEWNVMTDWRGIRVKDIIARAPKWLHDEYMEARKHPAIIHYAGPEKPWRDPSSDMASAFWEESRKTPYYELALERMVSTSGGGGLKAILKGGIPDNLWEKLYPVYQKLFPDRTRRREVMAHIYRKLVAGKKQ